MRANPKSMSRVFSPARSFTNSSAYPCFWGLKQAGVPHAAFRATSMYPSTLQSTARLVFVSLHFHLDHCISC